MNEIVKVIEALMPLDVYDALGVGVIDFKQNQFQAIEVSQFEEKLKFSKESKFYFDLASLTKPLTNSLSYFLRSETFNSELLLCLNHRAGLPSWGLLPKKGWQKQILDYPINESETLYSDFSALRVMLELKKLGLDQKNLCSKIWDAETLFWTDLPREASTPQYGFKNGLPNFGQVHDPNAWVIGEFCSHAGLFSTIDGLCRTLLNYQRETGFLEKIKADLSLHKNRFSFGWDRVENLDSTLAGKGCGYHTFGHLGFTGTSIWIDPDKSLGHVILSNATKLHWYNKQGLNDLRRALGEVIWNQQK
jgi:hypothetical protein